MSEPNLPNTGPAGGDGLELRGTGLSRAASVNLRRGDEEPGQASLLDPANQSLADALKITFRVLQLGMIALFALFMFSGFQSVRENERGIRLLFGRVTGDDLPPGFQYSLPYPAGELVKVQTGATTLELNEKFWPGLTDDQKKMSTAQLANIGKFTLAPGRDGSLLTADGNITHAKWRVTYVRRDPSEFVRNIHARHEEDIVRAAAHRGIVQAVAGVSIDDFLKQSGEQGGVASRARQIAQAMLDRSSAGIEIEQFALIEKIPPPRVLNDFSGVQNAQAAQGKIVAEAQSEADQLRTATAGAAVETLSRLIDLYERAQTLGDEPERERVHALIDAVFDGRAIDLNGVPIAAGLVSGGVASTINEAQQYRSTIVNRRRAEALSFATKLSQYEANPLVMVRGEWMRAYEEFMLRETVELMLVPRGVRSLALWLNRDPQLARGVESRGRLLRNQQQAKQRELERVRDRFTTEIQAQQAAQ